MHRSTIPAAALCLVLSAAVPLVAAAQPTAVKVGHLLDIEAERVIDDAVLLIEDGRFAGRSDAVPKGAELLDLSGYWVAPGLIDGHTHVLLQGDATAADRLDQGLRRALLLPEREG